MTIWTTLALCGLLGAGDATGEAGELRVYDLRSLIVPYSGDARLMQLVPCRGGGQPSSDGEGESSLDTGLVIELLRTLCAPEFEYEGRMLSEMDARLYVTAPAAVQQKVGEVLGFLSQSLLGQAELLVDELTLPEGQGPAPAALIGAEEAQRLLATAGAHRSWKLALRPGWTSSVASGRAIGIVSDWNVEIAQASAIHDPVIDSVPAGLALSCSGAAAPGGMWLSLALRSSETTGAKDHPLDFHSTVAPETGSVRAPSGQGNVTQVAGRLLQAGPRLWQSVPLALHALALNTYLPDGKALCLATSLSAGDQRSTHLFVLRRSGKPLAMQARFPADPKGAGARELLLVSTGWIFPPRCDFAGDLRGGAALPSEPGDGEPLAVVLQQSGSHGVQDLLGLGDGLQSFECGPWLYLARSSRSTDAPALDEVYGRIGRGAPQPDLLGAALVLRRGPNVIARASLALRTGDASGVVIGAEEGQLFDWNVEVAQGASAADPQIWHSFEGLCAHLRVQRGLSGGLTLALQAFGQVRNGESRSVDPQVASIGPMSVAAWDRLRTDERVEFAAEGPRRASFGDAGGQGLQLDVELVDLR